MSSKTRYENYRVVVEPRRLGDLGMVSVSDRLMADSEEDRQSKYRERCHDIKESIRRHVDEIGVVHVEFDTVRECEHCGAAWAEDDSSYNGGCCAKDQQAYESSQRV